MPIVGSGDYADSRRGRYRGRHARKQWKQGNLGVPGKPKRGGAGAKHVSKKERKQRAREAREQAQREVEEARRGRKAAKKKAKSGEDLAPSSAADAVARLSEAALGLDRLSLDEGSVSSAAKKEVRPRGVGGGAES